MRYPDHFWAQGNPTRPFLNKDTEVPKPKPNFIYTHLEAHDLRLKDKSQGREGCGHSGQ